MQGDSHRGLAVSSEECSLKNEKEKQRSPSGVGPVADRLPEYCGYRDEGCDLFHSCLQCPFPNCRYDEQLMGRRAATRIRDTELLRRRRLDNKSVSELARIFGVSKRTVQRIIRRSSDE
jgi:hypothetical protein